MPQALKGSEPGPVTEMAIVNTFTKLIFGDEGYTAREMSIIEAFRAMDANVARDSYLEMGEYLRNLGVREMIQLVSGLRKSLADGGSSSRSNGNTPSLGRRATSPHHRGTH